MLFTFKVANLTSTIFPSVIRITLVERSVKSLLGRERVKHFHRWNNKIYLYNFLILQIDNFNLHNLVYIYIYINIQFTYVCENHIEIKWPSVLVNFPYLITQLFAVNLIVMRCCRIRTAYLELIYISKPSYCDLLVARMHNIQNLIRIYVIYICIYQTSRIKHDPMGRAVTDYKKITAP